MRFPELEALPALQQPNYPDSAVLEATIQELESRAPLVSSHSVDEALADLALVEQGNAFLLQSGDCDEPFGTPEDVDEQLRLALAMTTTLMYTGSKKVVKMLRTAGQSAKPRSSDIEERAGIELPSYRGEMVNGPDFTEEARVPDPVRMLRFYNLAASKLARLEELTHSDFANLAHVNEWNIKLAESSTEDRYKKVTQMVSRAITFMESVGADIESTKHAEVYVSHEGLLLPYEQGLSRIGTDGEIYDSSAHMLWIGERTRNLDGAHVAFFRGVKNPIGVKIGPTATPEEVLALCERLNPDNIPGRLTLIMRMGATAIDTALPPIIEAVKQEGHRVIWSSDPMHGNTYTHQNGKKTRNLDTIFEEYSKFKQHCDAQDVWAGGLHIEASGNSVTECVGGTTPGAVNTPEGKYDTNCDPRLNFDQSLELAFMMAS